MLKKGIKLLIFIVLAAFVVFPNITVEAAAANIRYITTSVGAVETEVGINWHADVSTAQLIYGKAPALVNGITTINVTGTEWHADALSESDANEGYGFESRYVFKVNLTDLALNTTYYFKIVCGGQTSAVQNFKTANPNAAVTNILWTSDIHSTWEITQSNSAIQNTLSKFKSGATAINLVLNTGDTADRGGAEEYWSTFFSTVNLNGYVYASIPGNHEYYTSGGGSYINCDSYNEMYNNPQNGPECRTNSTYYFKYNNALFIMLDTIKIDGTMDEQIAWFKQVIKENPSEWIIVCSHAGCVTAGSYADDSKLMATYWKKVFQECQVDVCLSGHEHIYIRRDYAYNGIVDKELGVSYIVSASTGAKDYAIKSAYESSKVSLNGYDFAYKIPHSTNVISITKDKLTVQLYDKNGNSMGEDYCLTLSPKRPSTVSSSGISQEKVLNSVKLTEDNDNGKYILSWTGDVYGQMEDITVSYKSTYSTETSYSVYPTSIYMCKYEIQRLDEDYDFTITFKPKNGDAYTWTKHITNLGSINYVANDDGECANQLRIVQYVIGKSKTLPTPTRDKYNFIGWYDNAEFSGSPITEISATQTGEVTLYAKWEKKTGNITYVTNDDGECLDQLTVLKYNYGEVTTLPIPTREGYNFIGWFKDVDCVSELITDITADVEGDITVYALWEAIPKKGCNAGALIYVLLSLTATLGVFLVRKH